MLATFEVHVAHDWLDYVGAAAAVLAAAGTFAAVVWAIYGPAIRARRRRPNIELVNELDGTEAIYEAEDPEISDGVSLRVRNAAGRETAEEVEVFLSVYSAIPDTDDGYGHPMEIPIVVDENLNFDPNDGHLGQTRSTVPAALSRRVYLARLGDATELFESWVHVGGAKSPDEPDRWCGAWATVPARQDAIYWIRDRSELRIELTVAGRNFDAVRYGARVRATRSDLKALQLMDMKHPIDVALEWLSDLEHL